MVAGVSDGGSSSSVVDSAELAAAVRCLRGGGLVAFPTETVYGLGADALNERAVRAVFGVKGRPASNPLIVHVDSAEMARRVAGAWSDDVDRLARALWPGPLTVVVPRGEGVPDEVTAGGATVAVRCPDHPVALALIGAFGGPIVGPSANRSGGVSPTRAEHVRAEFGDEVLAGRLFVLDGGACRAGIESTVVELVDDVGGAVGVRVLRPGVIGREAIERALVSGRAGVKVVWLGADGQNVDEKGGGVERSPGRHGAHYRPRARVVLADDAASASELLRAFAERGERAAVIARVDDGVEPVDGVAVFVLPASAGGYAGGLYHALRAADAGEPGLIVVVRPWVVGRNDGADAGEVAIWEAVLERLGRCASEE